MEPLQYLDPMGEGMPEPIAAAAVAANTTLYNGSKSCASCGALMNPIQSLNSENCPSCNRAKAAAQVANRMV